MTQVACTPTPLTGAALDTRTRILIAGCLVAITLLGFFFIPGHTFLQSDTQIYLPILERLWDPSVLGRDPVATDPHVSYTIYDEAALLLRRLTTLDFQTVLVLQQLVFRALGLLGVFLIATSAGLAWRVSLLVTMAVSLGARIIGPEVLVFEYEPVPRGFAVPLVMLAMGLAAHRRYIAAGLAAAVAVLYHAPAALPFVIVFGVLSIWQMRSGEGRRGLVGLAVIAASALLLLLFARLQSGAGEPQNLFGTISPGLERLQRLRAPYNWISSWFRNLLPHYLFLWAVSVAAYLRIRSALPRATRFFFVGLPLSGVLSVPLAWVLLEKVKWILIPQIQPARALLFVVLFAVLGSAIAAMRAAAQRRWWETILWFCVVFTVPARDRVLQLVWPDPTDGTIRIRIAVVLGLAALTALAAWSTAATKRGAVLLWAAGIITPFFALPYVAEVSNYGKVSSPALEQVAEWARASTAKGTVFYFPDAGTGLWPGVFRAHAVRAVYVDWKGGGQVNLLPRFADEWWSRWERANAVQPGELARYSSLGIDFIVLRREHRLAAAVPAYENTGFAVYHTAGHATETPRATSGGV